MHENPLPPPFEATPQDIDQLRQLAIGFRVMGALCATCVNVLWVHFALGLTMLNDGHVRGNGGPGILFGALFSLFALALIVAGWVVGYLGFRTARFLEARRHWNFCFGMSIVYLLVQPLGTVLGVLAILVLNRSTVKAAFGPSPETRRV